MKPTIATATPAELREAFETPVTLKTIQCRWCHMAFKQTKRWQEFCRPACRNAFHNGAWEREAMNLRGQVQRLERDLEELRKELSSALKELKQYKP